MPGPLNNFQPQVINMTKYVSQIIQIQINKIVQIQKHFSSFYRVILTSYHQRDTLYKPTFCVITFENTDNFKRHLLAKCKYIYNHFIYLSFFLSIIYWVNKLNIIWVLLQPDTLLFLQYRISYYRIDIISPVRPASNLKTSTILWEDKGD